MILKYSIPGNKYTLHIRDARSIGGKCDIRFSDNNLSNTVGVTVLDPRELDVDDIIEAFFQNRGE